MVIAYILAIIILHVAYFMKCKLKSILIALPVIVITAGSLFYLDIGINFVALYYGFLVWFVFLFRPLLGGLEELFRSKLLYLTIRKHTNTQQDFNEMKNRVLALGVLYSMLESGIYVVPMALHYGAGMYIDKYSEVGRTILATHDIEAPLLVFLFIPMALRLFIHINYLTVSVGSRVIKNKPLFWQIFFLHGFGNVALALPYLFMSLGAISLFFVSCIQGGILYISHILRIKCENLCKLEIEHPRKILK